MRSISVVFLSFSFLAGGVARSGGLLGCGGDEYDDEYGGLSPCPPEPDAPLLTTYVIEDSFDPAAVGGTADIVEAPLDNDRSIPAIVLSYADPELGDVRIEYRWW